MTPAELVDTLAAFATGLTLAELLARHPGVARRTAQRWISQLIAERHHMPTQRARRQAPLGEVLRTYDEGGRLSVRRMPPGYRLSFDA